MNITITWELLIQGILGIGAILGASYSIWKFGAKPLVRGIHRTVKIYTDIEKILTELSPNGGKSMKDAIHRIEKILVTYNYKTTTLLEYLNIGFWECDNYGNCIFVNRALRKITGYDLNQFLNKNWMGIISEEDRERVSEEWEDCIQQQRSTSLSCSIVDCNGKVIPVYIESIVLRTESHEVLGYIGTVIPINKI